MLVAINKKPLEDSEFQEVRIVIVRVGNNDFRLRVDHIGNLVVNKCGLEDSAIHITPRVSNEIELT